MSRRAVMLVAFVGLAAGCAMPQHRVETAVSFERQAEVALAAGDQERALSFYQQAAEHWRGVGNHKIYAATLDSIARIHKNRGDFDLAVDAWQMALSVAKYAKDTDTVLRTLANLGIAHSAWGRYDEALQFYEESLQLAETLKHDASIARLHNNIGTVYRYQGKLDEALDRYQRALAIDRRLGDEGAIAARMANIGTVYMDRGDYKQARKHYETSLAAARKIGDQNKIAVRLNNLGAASYSLGDYEGALTYYREALELHNKLGQRHEAATVLSNIGSAYWYLERYRDAEQELTRSIDIKESLRKGATGDIRRDYLASQIDTYEWLTSTYVRASAFEKGLLAADSSRAKYLTDQLLSAGKATTLSDPKALTKGYLQQLGKDTAVVYFANVGWNQLLRFVATTDGVTAAEIDTTAMLARLAPRAGQVDASSLKGNRDALANAIMAYRELLTSVDPSDDAERDRQARILFDALLGDDRALTTRSRLVFVPDGSLAFLPFETLRTKKGYLIEDRLVTYTPSLAVAELIRQREKSAGKHAVLAMGGAAYDQTTHNKPVDKPPRGQLAWDAHRRQDRGLVLTDTYAGLGYGSFADLPGTRKEVNGIKRIVPDTEVLLGSSVTEARIKRMSRDGELANYRVLHFATHGIALPETPSLSALVLSQTKTMEGEDGFLTMAEIAKLRTDAEQVVLSACDTGLGKLYAGEGVVGLTQAFFVAGARAVAVSLWEVADDSTAELMLSAYDTIQTKGRSFAQAMAEAKRSLINGRLGGGRFARPYYWAPFVHYGSWSAGAPSR
jgi:CHAT domain-containing protein/predicted negative regulator of RcsB-dependent stress response